MQSSIKVKPASALKNTHSEQLSKLQHKHQHDADLLEDIRNFSKQRAQIEKEYAQALLKLSSGYLSKKDFYTVQDLPPEESRDSKTMTTVWKSILEVSENIAKERLQASETYMHQVSEPVKIVRQNKLQVGKKVFEQLGVIQAELHQTGREMIKAQKLYNEDEHVAHDARVKSAEAEAKLKRKSVGIFSSMATLQKNSAKLTTKKELSETKSNAARNEYLMNMVACNAQHVRFFQTDLPDLMQQLDVDMYEKVQEAFITLSKTELECCGITQESFSRSLCDAALISRNYNLQCFLHHNPVFSETLQFHFEAMDNDAVRQLVSDPKSDQHNLDNEAKKWASKVVKETKAIKEHSKAIRTLLTQSTAEKEVFTESTEEKAAVENTEQKLDELKEAIRKSETAKMKAEARLELIKQAGIDVDEWLNKANMDTLSPIDIEDDTSRTSISDQASLRTSSSHSHSEETNGASYNQNHDDYMYDDNEFNDDTFEVINPPTEINAATTDQYSAQAYALYDFPASNPDELSMTVHEPVIVIGTGLGDGWLKARNANGEEGFIPENYIQYYDDSTATTGDYTGQVDYNTGQVEYNPSQYGYNAETTAETSQPAPSSSLPYYDEPPGDIWADEENTENQQSTVTDTAWNQQQTDTQGWVDQVSADNGGFTSQDISAPASAYTSADYEVQEAIQPQQTSEGCWGRALYDYEATEPGELSFQEGQLIRIIRHDVNGVDDGWWEGEVNGKIGVFASLMVEELDGIDGVNESTTDGEIEPPDFAPPDMAPDVSSPPPVTLTLPTPSEEKSSAFVGFGSHISHSTQHRSETPSSRYPIEPPSLKPKPVIKSKPKTVSSSNLRQRSNIIENLLQQKSRVIGEDHEKLRSQTRSVSCDVSAGYDSTRRRESNPGPKPALAPKPVKIAATRNTVNSNSISSYCTVPRKRSMPQTSLSSPAAAVSASYTLRKYSLPSGEAKPRVAPSRSRDDSEKIQRISGGSSYETCV
ncbi:F-BAR and double SH3 domains protein 2-like [Tubulanus polymorphus]|uniref:F-BAR and double SH3 domains protein 2-like n=1 Tax=Tubulanus polymorphus TaxID=672921 RepID=UPI003DA4BE06